MTAAMSDAISSAFVSHSQYNYLVRSLQSSPHIDSDTAALVVSTLIDHYYAEHEQRKDHAKAGDYRKLISQNVAYVAAYLSRAAEEAVSSAAEKPFQNGVTFEALELMCKEHSKYKERNLQTFQDITAHHRNIKKGIIDDESNNKKELYSDEALTTYAAAAHYMGAKDWVIKGNDWMRSQALQYFLQGGAQKRRLRDERNGLGLGLGLGNGLKTLDSDKESIVASSGDKKRKASEPAEDSEAESLRLLDVGSCYNPFESPLDKDVFDVTALDLQPAVASSVYKCDFLELSIGDTKSQLVSTLLPGCSGGADAKQSCFELCQLPAHSYDVVCMSLVLSYLPSPQSRLTMVRKARDLLKSPSSSGGGYYGGLLLIVEKESVLAGAQAPHLKKKWREAIESTGFVQMRYEMLATRDRRSHCYAYRAVGSSSCSGDGDGLCIRSDYV